MVKFNQQKWSYYNMKLEQKVLREYLLEKRLGSNGLANVSLFWNATPFEWKIDETLHNTFSIKVFVPPFMFLQT